MRVGCIGLQTKFGEFTHDMHVNYYMREKSTLFVHRTFYVECFRNCGKIVETQMVLRNSRETLHSRVLNFQTSPRFLRYLHFRADFIGTKQCLYGNPFVFQIFFPYVTILEILLLMLEVYIDYLGNMKQQAQFGLLNK